MKLAVKSALSLAFVIFAVSSTGCDFLGDEEDPWTAYYNACMMQFSGGFEDQVFETETGFDSPETICSERADKNAEDQ